MKKIPILLIAVMVISVGFLSGCTGESDKFIGTWGSQKDYPPIIITFFSDNTYSMEDLNGETVFGTWEISEEKLIITSQGTTVIFSYSFYGEDTILSLTNVSSQQYVAYTKNYTPSKTTEPTEPTTLAMNIFDRDTSAYRVIWMVSQVEGEQIADDEYDWTLLDTTGINVTGATLAFNDNNGDNYVNSGDTFAVNAPHSGTYVFTLSDKGTGDILFESVSTKY